MTSNQYQFPLFTLPPRKKKTNLCKLGISTYMENISYDKTVQGTYIIPDKIIEKNIYTF